MSVLGRYDRPAPQAVLDAKMFGLEIVRSASAFTLRIDGESIVEMTGKVPEIHSLGLRPGGSGPAIAGIHAPLVQLADGRLMGMGRFDNVEDQQRFGFKMPVSYSSDLGETWSYEASEFPVVSSTQRPVLLRLKEGPIVLCSFTDQARTPVKERKGMTFKSTTGDYTGTGLYAAVSYDEGKTWPDCRLIATGNSTKADINGYLTCIQTRDGRIQLLTFNLAWLKQLPEGPKK